MQDSAHSIRRLDRPEPTPSEIAARFADDWYEAHGQGD